MTGPIEKATPRSSEAVRRIETWLRAEKERRAVAVAGGRVRSVEERDAGACSYQYDAEGELSAIVDAAGRSSRYRYDGEGRLSRADRADGSVATYAYEHDRLCAVEDRGVRSTFEHDAQGRLVCARRGNAGAVRFRYDEHGRVVEAATPQVATDHVFDEAGRIVEIHQSLDGVVISLRLVYDAAGRLSEMRLPGSEIPVRYRWAEGGRLDAVEIGDRTLARFAYRTGSASVETRLANGITELLDLDPVDGRPATLRVTDVAGSLFERRYEYAATGEIVSDGARRYRYDGAGRLSEGEEVATARRWRYEFSSTDAILRIDEPDGPRPLPQVTSDSSGRIVASVSAAEDEAYRYDDAGQLLEVLRSGSTVARFLYDHKGRLVRARHADRGERYLYGPEDELLAVTDEAGRPLRLYVRTPLAALALVRGPLGAPDAEIVHLHQDPRGTCHLSTGKGGEVVERFDCSPFGVPSPGCGERPQFGGRAYCPEVRMYWFGSRWYRPDLGRFLTPDSYTADPEDERLMHPSFPAGGQRAARAAALKDWLRRPRLRNRTAYCCNDPLNRTDPNGRWSAWVLLYAIGMLWALPNTLFGLAIEVTNIVFEAIHFLWWLISKAGGWNDPWQWIAFDAASSGNLDEFALVFEGGWFNSTGWFTAITFGNVIFADREWEKDPRFVGNYEVLPEAYGGKVAIKKKDILYEHELRHCNQYAWLGPFFNIGLPIWGAYLWSVMISGYQDSWFEADARRHSEGPTKVTGIRVKLRTQVGAAVADLIDAWVYWKVGAVLTTLRTDGGGILRTVPAPTGGAAAADATMRASYTQDFEAPPGATPRIYFSRCARPLPETFLRANAAMFQAATVTAPAGFTGPPSLLPPAGITLQEAPINLSLPADLSIWPLLWELPPPDYATAALPQGVTLFDATTGRITQADHAPARPPLPDATRPRERGLSLRGDIDDRATSATVELIDAHGVPLQLRQGRDSAAGVANVTAALAAAAAGKKPLAATIFPLDPSAAQGPVFVVVRSVGVTTASAPPIPFDTVAAFSCQLCGVQLALVNDASASASGASPGPPPGEADELLVLDFDGSPQASVAALRAQARCRRMVCYQMGIRDRSPAPGDPVSPQPEMPLWMAELQLLGMTKAQLEELISRRKEALPGNPATLEIAVQSNLHLEWDGPDALSGSPRLYRYSLDVPANQTAAIAPGADGKIADATLSPAPALPVAGRRAARLVVEGSQRRAWGRRADARSLDAVIVEWAPRLSAAAEVMRGGNGKLTVSSVAIAGAPIDPGLLTDAGGAIAPPAAGAQVLELPPFRVRGLNPANDPARLIDPEVTRYFNAHAAVNAVNLLTLALWQDLCRRIVGLESASRQFETNGTRTSGYAGQSYGLQQDMPLFGPPHGYGFGQHDNPPVTDDGAWSFAANIRESVRRIMEDKANAAYTVVSGHLGADLRRARAVFRRELVRRYNGRTEFTWTGSDWVIDPGFDANARWADAADHAKGANPLLRYPNQVLGTGVVYSNGAGAATTFPWPIAFTAADYGPGL